MSDDGLGATTEEEFAWGYDKGFVERRTANAQPKERRQGNRKTGESSYMCTGVPAARNKKIEVGDVGLCLGNWGLRAKKGANTVVSDRQIMGNPCQIIVLCEATPTVKALLEQPPTHIADRSCGHTGQAPTGNVQQEIFSRQHAPTTARRSKSTTQTIG